MEFNINNYVQVKLSQKGLKCYNDYKNQYGIKENVAASLDWLNRYHKGNKKGWYRFQLWDLMMIFGPSIYMGGPNMFDTNILIEINEETK